MLPPEIEQVLQQVQAHANYMPDWQMEVSRLSKSKLTGTESHVNGIRTRLAKDVLVLRQGAHCVSINWSSP
jgi:hypothetical protein